MQTEVQCPASFVDRHGRLHLALLPFSRHEGGGRYKMSLHGLCMWSQPARLPYPWPANLSPGVLQPPPHYQTAMQEAETLCPSAEDQPWGTTVHINILGAELGPWGILGSFFICSIFL